MSVLPREEAPSCVRMSYLKRGVAGKEARHGGVGRGMLRFLEKGPMTSKTMQQAWPKRKEEMQERQFKEGDRLQEGPKGKKQNQEHWV